MPLSSERPETLIPMPRERSALSRKLDTGFVWLTGLFAIGVAVILLTIAIQVAYRALPAIGTFGLNFLVTDRWDPVR
jgi:phosphate transport system permease protein